jgi:hypothetical protein
MIGTAEEFVQLRESDDPKEYVRAAHEHAPEAVWREVAERFPEMRIWVIHNKTVPLSILTELSADADVRVRGAVAAKRKLSRELFDRLALDPDESVRCAIIRNPKTPRDVLECLSHDPSEFVASSARNRLASG